MNAPAVSIRGLSKTFAITRKRRKGGGIDQGQLGALGHLLKQVVAPDKPEEIKEADGVQALRNVDLDVARGEVLGIIGRNGAGKSTLLKVLARVIDPSAGRVTLHGRVASLLELGIGFAPELTVRENIQLYARLNGLGRRDALSAEDRILAFAQLEEFRDHPLAKCPSGAFIRLAFSALVNMRADIILADEVLAVGDSNYRHACEERIRSAPQSGECVLFVSHDMNAIRRICTRVVWIDHGRIRMTGDTEVVVAAYENELLSGHLSDDAEDTAPCSILDLRLLGDDQAPIGALQMEAPAAIECVFRLNAPNETTTLAIELWRGRKAHIFTATCPERFHSPRPRTFRAALKLPADFLNESEYTAHCRLQLRPRGEPHATPTSAAAEQLTFNVFNTAPERSVWANWKWGRGGLLAPRLHWSMTAPRPATEMIAP